MKRMIIGIVILSMIVLAVGCTQQLEEPNTPDPSPLQNNVGQGNSVGREYQALVFAYSDSHSQISLNTEIDFDSLASYEEKTKTGQTMTFEFLGEMHEATYIQTHTFSYDSRPRHSYQNENCNFSIYDDGTVVLAAFKDPYLGMENVQRNYNEKQCLQVATGFFEDTFDSTANYDVEIKHISDMHRYEIRFIRLVNSWRTTEEVVVWVSDVTGEALGYRLRMPNQFSTDETVDFDEEKVRETIVSRLDEIYASVKDAYDKIEYEKMEYILTKTEDGAYAIICETESRLYGGGASFGNVISFLVTKK